MDAERSLIIDADDMTAEDGYETESDDDVANKGGSVTVHNFSQAEKKILLDAQSSIKALVKKSERARVVKNAETSILSLTENKKLKRDARAALSWKTKQWLAKHAQIKHTKKATKHWTGRTVLYELEPQAIKSKQSKLYEAAVRKGQHPKDEFNFFQLALSYVWKKLPDDEKTSYRKTAIQWNNEGPSPEVKAK